LTERLDISRRGVDDCNALLWFEPEFFEQRTVGHFLILFSVIRHLMLKPPEEDTRCNEQSHSGRLPDFSVNIADRV